MLCVTIDFHCIESVNERLISSLEFVFIFHLNFNICLGWWCLPFAVLKPPCQIRHQIVIISIKYLWYALIIFVNIKATATAAAATLNAWTAKIINYDGEKRAHTLNAWAPPPLRLKYTHPKFIYKTSHQLCVPMPTEWNGQNILMCPLWNSKERGVSIANEWYIYCSFMNFFTLFSYAYFISCLFFVCGAVCPAIVVLCI